MLSRIANNFQKQLEKKYFFLNTRQKQSKFNIYRQTLYFLLLFIREYIKIKK